MDPILHKLWTPLAPTSLLWLAVTLGAYCVGLWIQQLTRGAALANPVLIAMALVETALRATSTSYATYFSAAQFINFLLGPATVALAVPLANNFREIRRSLPSLGLALSLGSVTAITSGTLLVWGLGGTRDVALSMAPKAATTPIAMAVSQTIGGIPALTAAFAILGGVIAAIIGEGLLHWLNVRDWRSHGLAAGLAGSGVAAAQIAPRDGLAAAYAALAIGLNGLLTSVLAPLLAYIWH